MPRASKMHGRENVSDPDFRSIDINTILPDKYYNDDNVGSSDQLLDPVPPDVDLHEKFLQVHNFITAITIIIITIIHQKL